MNSELTLREPRLAQFLQENEPWVASPDGVESFYSCNKIVLATIQRISFLTFKSIHWPKGITVKSWVHNEQVGQSAVIFPRVLSDGTKEALPILSWKILMWRLKTNQNPCQQMPPCQMEDLHQEKQQLQRTKIKNTGERRDVESVSGHELHLSPQMQKECIFIHRRSHRAPAESWQESLATRKEYMDTHKTW